MDRLKIDSNFWRLYADELKYSSKPICWHCNKELKTGDYIDHYYPYYQEKNICKECKTKGL